MNGVQTDLLSMYIDIKDVLDRHGIPFYVQFGTAIGAVRHDGFIPWDDDIDLLVWENDVETVNKVLSEELNPELYYYHIPSADTHPHVIRRAADMEGRLKARDLPFIDIFPISRYPSKRFRQVLFDIMVWGNVGTIWAIDHTESVGVHRCVSWIPGIFKKMADVLVDEHSDMTVIYATTFKDYIFPENWYGTPVIHKFETSEVPLPEKYHEMLTAMFGDYMTPPPEDCRTGASGFPCGAFKDYVMEHRKRTP